MIWETSSLAPLTSLSSAEQSCTFSHPSEPSDTPRPRAANGRVDQRDLPRAPPATQSQRPRHYRGQGSWVGVRKTSVSPRPLSRPITNNSRGNKAGQQGVSFILACFRGVSDGLGAKDPRHYGGVRLTCSMTDGVVSGGRPGREGPTDGVSAFFRVESPKPRR